MDYNRFWVLAAKRLSGDATKEELHELDILISTYPEAEQLLTEAKEAWSSATRIAELQTAGEEHVSNLRNKIAGFDDTYVETFTERPIRKNFLHKKPVIFGIIILIAGFAAYFLINKSVSSKPTIASASENTVFVEKGSKKTTLTLPDGSIVKLNADSRIFYGNDFSQNRILRLEGEAYFDVVKDPSRPFRIQTADMQVKVLGTAFNVRSYQNETFSEATLIHGSIEVVLNEQKDQRFVLQANQKINVTRNKSVAQKEGETQTRSLSLPEIAIKPVIPDEKDNVIREIAWTENKLYLEGQTFTEAAVILERWFGKKITIEDDKLKNVRYTANFEEETLEQVLQALQISVPFRYKIDNNNVFIY